MSAFLGSEFFNSHRRLHQLRVNECNGGCFTNNSVASGFQLALSGSNPNVGCGRSLWPEQRAVDNRPTTLPVRPFLAIKTDAGQGCSGLAESLVKTQCAFVRIKSR
jgi:hypothetical protein